MDCKKVQYPSFKMALIFPKNKNIAKDSLTGSMKQAYESLSNTKFVDVEINEVDNPLYTVKYLYPYLNKKGKLFYKQHVSKNFVSIDNAVQNALRLEASISLMDEYKKSKAVK